MWNWVYGVLLWLDEGLNALIIGFIGMFVKIPVPAEGNAHYTVSQVLAELRARGEKVGCVGCKILTAIWGLWIKKRPYDHCTDAMQGMPDNVDAG